VAYVVGMVVDFAGYLLLKPIRDSIRKRVNKRLKVNITSSTDLECTGLKILE